MIKNVKQLWGKYRIHTQKTLLLGTKIAFGSALAIFVARYLGLSHDVSAGTITMLTLMTTKWQTVKLSVSRVLTFALATLIAWIIFLHISNAYAAYGVFMFLLVCISAMLGLTATVSVNAVIGAHLFTGQDFSAQAIGNEFKLVCIGIVIALVLNLYHDNGQRKKELIANMRSVENQLQQIILELAAYLIQFQMSHNLWGHIYKLERELERYIKDAHEYQDNTFHFHPEYYIDYFEMRHAQCQVLDNLHNELRRIRSRPKQAQIIAEYLLYVADYVVEIGKSGIWTYQKWNSGIAECWGIYSASGVNLAASHYSGFYYSASISVSLPFTFAAAPVGTYSGGCTDYITFVTPTGQPTTTQARFWIACLDASANNCSVSVSMMIRGRWK